MALTVGELVAYITSDNRGFRRGVSESRRDMERFQRDANGRLRDVRGRFVREGEESGRGFGGGLVKAAGTAISAGFKAAGSVLAPLAGLPLKLAAVATTAVSVAPLLASAGAALYGVGQAAVAASPMLLSFAAAGLFVKATLAQIFAEGSAARKALQPLGDMFTSAGARASEAAARGIRPLVDRLREVAGPHVERAMVGIGKATNRVMREFLGWAKSTDGVKALRGILEPITAAADRLAPSVSRVAISFAEMLGRITGVSMAAGSRGLGGILEWLADKFDGINADTVTGGLNKLKSAASAVGSVLSTLGGWIGTLVDAYRMYSTEFRAVADVVSVAAIIFGGPVTAAIAAAGLIIRHFDEVKAAYASLKESFSGGGGVGSGFLDNLRTAAAEVLPSLKAAFADVKAAVLPVLQEIWQKITTDLVPAFGEFIAAASPVVSWLIDTLGPAVATTFQNILAIISGAIDIIIGLFKFLTGVLTGDWSQAWDGIKQILSGAWQIIAAIFQQGVNVVRTAFSLSIGILKGIASRAVDAVVDAFSALGRGASGAIRAGVGAVRNAAGSVKSAVLGVFRGAGSWLVSAGRAILDGLISGVRSAIGKLRGLLNSVTGMIPDWKGPMAKDLTLLRPSGEAIMSGLVDGIAASVPDLRAQLGQVTTGIAQAVSAPPVPVRAAGGDGAAAPATVRVVVDARGGDDEFLRWLRNAIRVEGGGDVQVALGKG